MATRDKINERTATTATRGEGNTTGEATTRGRLNRLWRYAPLVAWLALVLFNSTGAMSASNTSLVIEPLLRWLFPHLSEAQFETIHFFIRKCAHFTEYATLALLAARAFIPSTKDFLRQHWLTAALLLVVCVSLLDEFNQSFNPARTGTIKDSALDTFGGATALIVLAMLRVRRARRAARSF
jgi:VanZ family protein